VIRLNVTMKVRFPTKVWRAPQRDLLQVVLLLSFLAFSLFIYRRSVFGLNTLTAEIYQRERLPFASNLLASITRASPDLGDQRSVENLLRSLGALHRDTDLYLIRFDGKIVSSSIGRERILLEKVEMDNVILVEAQGGVPGVLTLADPTVPSVSRIFSVATTEDRSHHLLALFKDVDLKSFFGGLRTAREFRLEFCILAVICGTVLIFRIRKGRVFESLPPEAPEPNRRSDDDEVSLFAATAQSVADSVMKRMQGVIARSHVRASLVQKFSPTLREPLSQIVEEVDELMSGRSKLPTMEVQKRLSTVASKTDEVISRVERIFELVRYDSIKLSETPQLFAAYECIQDIVFSLKSLAEERSIAFEFIPIESGPLLCGDIELLYEAFSRVVRSVLLSAREGSIVRLCAVAEGEWTRLEVVSGRSAELEDILKSSQVSVPGHTVNVFSDVPDPLYNLMIARKIVDAHAGAITTKAQSGRVTISLRVRSESSDSAVGVG